MALFFKKPLWGVHITPTLHMPAYIAIASPDKEYVTQIEASIIASVKSAETVAGTLGFQVKPTDVAVKKILKVSPQDDYPVIKDGAFMEFVPYFFVVSKGIIKDGSLERTIERVDVQVMNLTLAKDEEVHAKFYAGLFADPNNAYSVLYREKSLDEFIVEHMVTFNPGSIPLRETNFQL